MQFWAEVKGLADSSQVQGFELARVYLAPRLKELPCAVDLYASEQADHREYKLLHHLIRNALAGDSLPAFALLSDGYTSKAVYRYKLAFRSGQLVPITAHLKPDVRIVAPWQLDRPTFGQIFELHTDSNMQTRTLRNYTDEFLVGAHLFPTAGHCGLLGTRHSKGMWRSTNQTRLRRDVAKANQQFSAACELENLPGVVFLVGYASAQAFVSALLGDTMIAVPTRDGETELAYYGRNGALKRQQNTHVSAAYLLSGDNIYFFANPFARQPIDNILPDAHVISINDKGEVIVP